MKHTNKHIAFIFTVLIIITGSFSSCVVRPRPATVVVNPRPAQVVYVIPVRRRTVYVRPQRTNVVVVHRHRRW